MVCAYRVIALIVLPIHSFCWFVHFTFNLNQFSNVIDHDFISKIGNLHEILKKFKSFLWYEDVNRCTLAWLTPEVKVVMKSEELQGLQTIFDLVDICDSEDFRSVING